MDQIRPPLPDGNTSVNDGPMNRTFRIISLNRSAYFTFAGPVVGGQAEAGGARAANRAPSLYPAAKLASRGKTGIPSWKIKEKQRRLRSQSLNPETFPRAEVAGAGWRTPAFSPFFPPAAFKQEMTHCCRCIHLHRARIRPRSNSGSYRVCSRSAGSTVSRGNRTRSHLESIRSVI